jgi:hypothetical protein
MHAVVLPALRAMAEIGIIKIAGEQEFDGATKTRTAMLLGPRQER